MKIIRVISLIALGFGLTACVSDETVTRNTPIDTSFASETVAPARSYTVQDVLVMVPSNLRVSEANSYYPIADIVWRGDALGNRHMQVAQIIETAAAVDAEQLTGNRAVVAEVVLNRFHGVTERTRFSVGGVYNFVFTLTVRDALSGEIIEAPRQISADLPAPGGNAALALDNAGQTEKVRVTAFIANVLATELGGGYGAI